MRLFAPSDFRTTHWKNGKGVTTELAISEGGTLVDFDWRISMASVIENGAFSDFCGYDRCLLLLEGAGLQLAHEMVDGQQTNHCLEKRLDMALFDGGSITTATLIDGSITDFNIMSKTGHWRADTRVCFTEEELILNKQAKTFVFSAVGNTQLKSTNPAVEWELLPGHLLQFEAGEYLTLSLRSLGCIVTELYPVTG